MGIMAIISSVLSIADHVLGLMEINKRRKYTDQLFIIKEQYREERHKPYDQIDDVKLYELTNKLTDLFSAISNDMVGKEPDAKA